MNIPNSLSPASQLFIPAMLSLLILLFFLPTGFSQAISSTTQRNTLIEMQNDLLVKSRKQKTWAWVILGTGILGTAVNGLAVASGGSNLIFSFGQGRQILERDISDLSPPLVNGRSITTSCLVDRVYPPGTFVCGCSYASHPKQKPTHPEQECSGSLIQSPPDIVPMIPFGHLHQWYI